MTPDERDRLADLETESTGHGDTLKRIEEGQNALKEDIAEVKLTLARQSGMITIALWVWSSISAIAVLGAKILWDFLKNE